MLSMRHEGIEGTATSTEKAFTEVWEPLGWERVSEAEVLSEEVTGRAVDDLNKLKIPELEELAAARGLAVPDGAKKADLVSLIEGTITDHTPEA